MEFKNINTALVGLLANIDSDGRSLVSRGLVTREIGPIQLTLRNPRQRCLIVPRRNNNIFASIAETMWVLAGRNDVAFLENYLPRAVDFSDDGATWRAAYGPRLRDWGGIDQVDEVRKILLADRGSRRAVAAIFDPAKDYVVSKDIPCNNWLNFTIRDGVLNCHVAVRSNDVMWGFSGINSFEWSVLLEMIAFWVDAGVGGLTFSVTSAHIYDRHFQRADEIVSAGAPGDLYSDKTLSTYAFSTAWPEFSRVMEEWFSCEEEIRLGSDGPRGATEFPDPLLGAFLQMVRVYWAIKSDRPASVVLELIEPLRGSDLAEAALEYASRTAGGFPAYRYPGDVRPATHVPTPGVGSRGLGEWVGAEKVGGPPGLWPMISALHASKSRVYGDSWKRRGERIGIMANIARKVDRLQLVDASAVDVDETALDTAVDLLVYSIKYATYLIDAGEMEPPSGLRHEVAPFSDGLEGFDAMLAGVSSEQLGTLGGLSSPECAVQGARDAYEVLERIVEGDSPRSAEKADALRGLVRLAAQLVLSLAQASPESYLKFLQQVESTESQESPRLDAASAREERVRFFAEHNATRRFSYE